MFAGTEAGSSLKWLLIVGEVTRECLTLKFDRGIRAEGVRSARFLSILHF